MDFQFEIKENINIDDDKIKTMCELGYEDNDFCFTMQDGKYIILDKNKYIICIEGSVNSIKINQYIEYLQDVQRKRNKRIILTTLSPDTHRTSEENLGLSYLAAVLRKNGYNVEIIDGWLEGLNDDEVLNRILEKKMLL